MSSFCTTSQEKIEHQNQDNNFFSLTKSKSITEEDFSYCSCSFVFLILGGSILQSPESNPNYYYSKELQSYFID